MLQIIIISKSIFLYSKIHDDMAIVSCLYVKMSKLTCLKWTYWSQYIFYAFYILPNFIGNYHTEFNMNRTNQ